MSKTDDIPQELVKALRENSDLMIALESKYYKENFQEFVKEAWKIIEPGQPYSHNWHIDYLSEEVFALFRDVLEDVYPNADWDAIEEETTRRLNINVPTRSMKTVLISILIPCWLIIHKPTLKFATVSYSDDLATEINNKRRTIISSEWYQKRFGDVVKIAKGADRQDSIIFESQGSMYSTSIAGTFTGKGADVIILDDPQKPNDMGTPAQREKAIKFFQETLPTRLNNQNTGVIINIQQRLHYLDLSGFVMENLGSAYKYIKIPLLFEEDREYVGMVTGRKWHPKAGDPLWPDRMGHKAIETLRINLGSKVFAAQQQQEPTPESGAIVSMEWLAQSAYGDHPLELLKKIQRQSPEQFERFQLVMSWDMNYASSNKKQKDSDYVACAVGVYDPLFKETILIEVINERMQFTQTLVRVKDVFDKYDAMGFVKAPVILIEEKANGGPIIQLLQEKVSGVVPFDPKADNKVTRLEAVAPQMESGKVRIPNEMSNLAWREPFLTQLLRFPMVDHDDMVDAFSQLLLYNNTKSRGGDRQWGVIF